MRRVKKKLDEIGLGRIELMSPSRKILLLHERMMKWGWRDLERWRTQEPHELENDDISISPISNSRFSSHTIQLHTYLLFKSQLKQLNT